MGSSSFEEADGGGHFVDGGIDSERLVRAVTNLARSTTDTESILLLLSSIRFNQEEGRENRNNNDIWTLTRKRHSEIQRTEKDDGNKRARRTVDKDVEFAKGKAKKEGIREIEEFECENCERSFANETALKTHKNSCAGEAHIVDLPTSQTPSKGAASNSTPDKLNSKYDKGKTRFPCKQCKGEYSTKGNLARHVKLTHLGKKPEEVVATKVVSNKNKNEKNTTKAEPKREPKCEKTKCVFCDKELCAIYRHYGNIHNIEYPEQLLFFNSNVLVISDIDTKGGKAPWFLREADKAKRYTPTTCRLCETECDDPAVLENHYRSDHKVVPGALERLQHLFRAKKGAHLADLPASRDPSKLQKSTLRPPQGEPLSGGLVTDTKGYVSAAEHNNRKLDQEIEKQDATINTTLQNVQNDSRINENSAAGPEQGNRQPIQILEDTNVSEFCNVCNKSIMYSYFEAHAATHKNNKYVAVEADCTQKIKETTTQEQRASPGKYHEKSSDVVQVGVHEQNSETNSIAIHQAQDTEEGLVESPFSPGLTQDLERALQILLGDRGNDTCLNESTSDNSYTSTQIRDILETTTTEQETSEMDNDNDREQLYAGIQNNNDDSQSMVHSRNDACGNISQDIFTSEPFEIHRENSEICELSQDQEHVDIADNIDDINESNANETISESEHENDGHMQRNPKSSTRDNIRSFEDTTSGFNADTGERRRNEEKRKIDEQRLIDETKRIRDIMFSRD